MTDYNRIQNASVLVAGVRALSNELCKNLALAGIGSITLLDDKVVDDDDLGVQFFLEEGARGKNVSIWVKRFDDVVFTQYWISAQRQ